MMQEITQRLQKAKNARNIPRHKIVFHSFIIVASSALVILVVAL